MGREVGLLLIVVILAIGEVWQEREPGTKVGLSRAGACLCVRAMPQRPAARRRAFSAMSWQALGYRGRGAALEHPKHPCSFACQASGKPHWLMRVQAAASSIPVLLGACSQGPLGCPCWCYRFGAGDKPPPPTPCTTDLHPRLWCSRRLLQSAAVIARSRACKDTRTHGQKWARAAWQLQPPWWPSGANTPGKSGGRGGKAHDARGVPGEHGGANPAFTPRSTCASPLHPPRTGVLGSSLRPLHIFSKPLPQPAPIPIPVPVPVAAPRPTGTSGLSRALAHAEPFISPSGFLSSQGRFLHRPEMREGVGRTRVCGKDHQHQEAVCSR